MNSATIRAMFVQLLLMQAVGVRAQVAAGAASPLVIGETFTIESKVLGEVRRINVYRPAAYDASEELRLPVLYMPDGGVKEDFLHIAGLVQVSTGNGTMRPFLLVGIENTARRRDLTGSTASGQDSTIAPVVGGSATFRRFLREELKPLITSRYRTTNESAIVGESLAGLFVVETLFLEPDLFDTYIAFDPSLWWNDADLVERAAGRLDRIRGRTLYVATSDEAEIARLTRRLTDIIGSARIEGFRIEYQPMPAETHATIFHPAAIEAFRRLFGPSSRER